MSLRAPGMNVLHETLKSAAAGLLGAVVPHLRSLGGAEAAVVHAARDVMVDLAPTVFLNALMSALVPAFLVLRRERCLRSRHGHDLLRSLVAPATVVTGLAAVGTVAVLGAIGAAAYAFPASGLAAAGVTAVGAGQAVLVAAVLTPSTIVILSRRRGRG